jgi:hypothetical protein
MNLSLPMIGVGLSFPDVGKAAGITALIASPCLSPWRRDRNSATALWTRRRRGDIIGAGFARPGSVGHQALR